MTLDLYALFAQNQSLDLSDDSFPPAWIIAQVVDVFISWVFLIHSIVIIGSDETKSNKAGII